MYMYSTCMQRGSLHRHIVDVVLCLMVVIGAIVTCLLCKVWLLIVTNLLYKVRAHIVPVPIERFVVIDFIVGIVGDLGLESALDFGAAPPPEKAPPAATLSAWGVTEVIDLMVLHIHYGIVSLPHSGSRSSWAAT